MPHTLALFLCTVFVCILLRIDRKQTPGVSAILWVPTLWFLYIASKPLGVWFPLSGGNPDSGSPLDRKFLIGLLFLGFIILSRKKFDWSTFRKENTWLLLLTGYMLVSILWSDIPFISFKRWIRELVAIVMVCLVLTEHDPCLAVQSVFRRTAYILIPFSLLLIKYYPEYGVEFHRWSGERMWIGVTMQKNGLGRLCLISSFFLFWSLVRSSPNEDIAVSKYQTHADVFILFLALYLISGGFSYAYSATAITTFAIGLVFFVILFFLKKFRMNLSANWLKFFTSLIVSVGIITVFVGGSTISGLTSSVGRDTTLTGRTDIWATLLPIAMERPIWGHGFGGFWTTSSREALYGLTEAHNGYLDLLLELGFIGVFFFMMFIFTCCRKAQKTLYQDYSWGSLWICLLFMTLIHNITETSVDSFTSHLMAVLLFFNVSFRPSTSEGDIL